MNAAFPHLLKSRKIEAKRYCWSWKRKQHFINEIIDLSIFTGKAVPEKEFYFLTLGFAANLPSLHTYFLCLGYENLSNLDYFCATLR